jgi:hypothetical protein
MPQWTNERPTEPGYYWIRNFRTEHRTVFGVRRVSENYNCDHIALLDNEGRFLFSGVDGDLDLIGGEFSGPIEAPQQLKPIAGLYIEKEHPRDFSNPVYHIKIAVTGREVCKISGDVPGAEEFAEMFVQASLERAKQTGK